MLKNVFLQQWCLFDCNVLSVNPLKCVSLNNSECKVRPEIDINSNEPLICL